MFSNLPSMWSAVRLRDISEDIERIDPASLGEGSFKYIDISSIDNKTKEIIDTSVISNKRAPSRARQIIKKDDILVSTVRPNLNAVAIVPKEFDSAICSTGFCVLRPITSKVIPEYLFVWVTNVYFVAMMTRLARGIGYPAVTDRDVYNSLIPLPPLPEQQRIVEILKQADTLRRQRREILDQAKQLPTALFLEMFGDPNERKSPYKKRTLGKLCKIVGGGTPATARQEFWNGDIPWVSPKDMKELYINDAEDHISENAIEESATNLLPKGSVLVVTRSGILKHTFPVAITSVDVAINQDIKAILLPETVLAEFFAVQLLLFAPRLLAKVRIGATVHNIETEELKRLQIIAPPLNEQKKFVKRFRMTLDAQAQSQEFLARLDTLATVTSAQAFSGELTETWRKAHHDELAVWLRDHPECLPKKSTRVTIKETAPTERLPPARPERRWLMDQLSETQSAVYLALQEWKGTLIPSEDLDSFLAEWPIEHLEDAHDQIRRALNQLAGLGLIARVSLPNDQGEYVTSYRVLREDELSRADDLERLGGAA